MKQISNMKKVMRKKVKNRKRKILWFNPPWNDSVKTNIGRNFLKIMEKNFKKGNKLYQIFNRNSCKVSYRTSPNLGMIINSHNKKILRQSKMTYEREFNCRIKENCPLGGKCLSKNIIYRANITPEEKNKNIKEESYVGLTATKFKE